MVCADLEVPSLRLGSSVKPRLSRYHRAAPVLARANDSSTITSCQHLSPDPKRHQTNFPDFHCDHYHHLQKSGQRRRFEPRQLERGQESHQMTYHRRSWPGSEAQLDNLTFQSIAGEFGVGHGLTVADWMREASFDVIGVLLSDILAVLVDDLVVDGKKRE
jgi:hypothetical protein